MGADRKRSVLVWSLGSVALIACGFALWALDRRPKPASGAALTQLAAHVVRIRSAAPAGDDRAMPAPWSVHLADDDERRAMRAYLDAAPRWFDAFDELHADDASTAFLLGDESEHAGAISRLAEARWCVNALGNRAQFDVADGSGSSAVRRIAEALEIGLLVDGHEIAGLMTRASVLGLTSDALSQCLRSPAWDRRAAWTLLPARLRAFESGALAYRSTFATTQRALVNRARNLPEGIWYDESNRADPSTVELVLVRTRMAQLALAADQFQLEHGRWPTRLEDLHGLVAEGTTEYPCTGRVFTLGAGATAGSLSLGASGPVTATLVPYELSR